MGVLLVLVIEGFTKQKIAGEISAEICFIYKFYDLKPNLISVIYYNIEEVSIV